MQKTTNFELCQWESSDRILMDDFNGDNANIDAALTAHAAALAGHTAALAQCGNCKLWTTTYVGTGQTGASSPCSVTFPEMPLLVMVLRHDGLGMSLIPGCTTAQLQWGSNFVPLTVVWQGTTLSWYCTMSDPTYQLNTNGTTYHVFALIKAD